MGASMQYRKKSMILAATLNGTWVSELESHGYIDRRRVEPFFGMSDPLCNRTDMMSFYESQDPRFDFIKWEESVNLSTFSLCSLVLSGADLSFMGITNRTVFMFPQDYNPTLNYCTYNSLMRHRFRESRAAVGVLPRPPTEFWVAVHFRWGDTATGSVEHPDIRQGIPLHRAGELASQFAKEVHDRAVRIFFLSEGEPDVFRSFVEMNPTAEMLLELTVEETLDILWRSDVLIGGNSAFFAIGMSLNNGCVVVLQQQGSEGKAFVSSIEEGEASRFTFINP